ncbi:MAG: hypothetical protein ACFB6S_13690 [Geminicoccaceae bacterium]
MSPYKPEIFVIFLVLAVGAGSALPSLAGDVTVVDTVVTAEGGNSYRFDVTLEHADEGWDHYADGWEVVGPDGEVLGTRPLAHPHVNEQPFTRSLSGVTIPEGITTVRIRANDSVHGKSELSEEVALPDR